MYNEINDYFMLPKRGKTSNELPQILKEKPYAN